MSAVSSDDVFTVTTEYGPLRVTRKVFNDWQFHGWPDAATLQRLVEQAAVEATQ